MSVNIGTAGVNAVHELRGNHHFEDLIAAIGLFSQNAMLSAMASDPVLRTDQTAYARGMYHLWQALESAYTGKHPSQTKPPPLASTKATTKNASSLLDV